MIRSFSLRRRAATASTRASPLDAARRARVLAVERERLDDERAPADLVVRPDALVVRLFAADEERVDGERVDPERLEPERDVDLEAADREVDREDVDRRDVLPDEPEAARFGCGIVGSPCSSRGFER